MTEKSQLRWLEKLFVAEVCDALPFQSNRKKQMTELESDGLIQPMEIKMGMLTIPGWQLTHRGRITYCSSCAETK